MPGIMLGMNENETKIAALKIAALTVAGAVAEITLERWLTVAILVYTLAQLYFLVRDKWWRDRKRKGDDACAQCDAEQGDAGA